MNYSTVIDTKMEQEVSRNKKQRGYNFFPLHLELALESNLNTLRTFLTVKKTQLFKQ